MRYTLQSEHLRRAEYSERKVHLPNASAIGYGKNFAERGDIVSFAYDDDGRERHIGRVLGRVDAPGDGPAVPPVEEWLAVLTLNDTASSACIRWIHPLLVYECRSASTALAAFFFQPTESLPSLPAIHKLDALGSLSESYIAKYAEACDRCIVSEGLFADQRCTHKR
jgi:hypothetical protein